MSLKLHMHPLSSFCHKALIALYENGTAFDPVLVDLGDPASRAAFSALWPMAKMPVLRDEGRDCTVAEATVDDALVHRRMLHGRPDVVVAVVDADSAGGDLAEVLAPRLGITPLVLAGDGAAAAEPAVRALLEEAAGEGTPPDHEVVPGHDPDAVVRVAADLVRRATPPAEASAPLLSGHCAH